MRSNLVFFGLAIWLLSSCSTCDDCDGYVPEPTIGFTLINADSLELINESLEVTNTTGDSLDLVASALSDTLNFLSDSLDIIEDSIQNGGNLDDELTSITASIEMYENLENQNNVLVVQYDSLSLAFEDLHDLVASGYTPVDSILNTLNGRFIIPEDTLEVYNVPLNYNDSISGIGFNLQGQTYSVTLSHTNLIEVDVRGNALITYSNIDTVALSHSFKSIEIQCETKNCKAYETVLVCYY